MLRNQTRKEPPPLVSKSLSILLLNSILHIPLPPRMRILPHQHPLMAMPMPIPIPTTLLLIPRPPPRHLRLMPKPDLAIIPIVILKRIRLLAVDGEVANLEHLVRHAQRDAADVLDEDHDERGPDDVPADDEEGAHDLEADLSAVAGYGAAGVGDAEGGAAFGCGPETCVVVTRVSL